MKFFLSFFIASVFVFTLGFFVVYAAPNPFNISFPISELGACDSTASCRTYCDDGVHIETCNEWALSHGIKSSSKSDLTEQDTKTQKIISIIESEGGPGGCSNKSECRSYCDDISHRTECLDFAEKHGFIAKGEVLRAKKISEKPGPGGCRGEACRVYCAEDSHFEECTNFALNNSFFTKDEASRKKKFVDSLEHGAPGGCTTPVTCRAYCEDVTHQEECIAFAKKGGFLSASDEKHFDTLNNLEGQLKHEGGPGKCTSIPECKIYCSKGEHLKECLNFGREADLISEDELYSIEKELGNIGHDLIEPQKLPRNTLDRDSIKEENDDDDFGVPDFDGDSILKDIDGALNVSPEALIETDNFLAENVPIPDVNTSLHRRSRGRPLLANIFDFLENLLKK